MDQQWVINTMGVIANIRAAVKVLPDGGRIIPVGSGLGTRNITVNVVQAGMMDTDMAAGSKGKLPPIVMESRAIQRYAAVEEVAAAIVLLAGPDARFVTGSVIDFNGGFTA